MSEQQPSSADVLARLAAVLESRKPENGGDPDKSYVARLFHKGDDAILKKIGEEATETVMAAKDARAAGLGQEAVGKVVYEVADLWFHSMVLLARFGLQPADVVNELARREGLSGLEEKAQRKTDGT
ncbi:phosphoribosyl-ATP diphosphatase [Cupriavidus basilensis]|uniref:Phosphoribosyl-ATP pyrophosphatase n=1 Tax=Cupriavidus basilensis TaxID=68895 RepID=A0ABT6AM75_9BURK|nr:phosphoribosyl-ATP diphosphatase [Cupriavidus basilensis]MDF3833708.1 phosphoribosyl-ATP diphosphatase [Cupriavidus basilensis]